MEYLQWMVNMHNQKTKITDSRQIHANLLESLINLSVSDIILLFSIKCKLSSPYNRVLRVKGARCLIAFLGVTLGLLYRGQNSKK